MPSSIRTIATAFALLLAAACGGCAVVTVAGAAASVAVTGAGLAVDAAVGTVKAAGSVAGAVLPGGNNP